MAENKNKMQFLVIGAQKCATTWLYQCLKEHPQICLPENKREIEYLGGDLYKSKGADWYFSLVAGAKSGQLQGDVSVEYLFNPESSKIVKDLIPDVKLITSLRNPTERAISAYYWYLRKGLIADDKNIVETFKYLKECYLAQKMDTPGIDIITRGLYDIQLKRYLNYFPAKNLMIIYYDEINDEPLRVLNKLYRFLNISTDVVPQSLNERPKQNSHSKWLMAFERINPKSRIIAKISDILNQLFSGKKSEKKYSEVEAEAYDSISGLFTESIDSTQKIISSLPLQNQPLQTSNIQNWKKTLKNAY